VCLCTGPHGHTYGNNGQLSTGADTVVPVMIISVVISLQSVKPGMGSLPIAHASDTPQSMHI